MKPVRKINVIFIIIILLMLLAINVFLHATINICYQELLVIWRLHTNIDWMTPQIHMAFTYFEIGIVLVDVVCIGMVIWLCFQDDILRLLNKGMKEND